MFVNALVANQQQSTIARQMSQHPLGSCRPYCRHNGNISILPWPWPSSSSSTCSVSFNCLIVWQIVSYCPSRPPSSGCQFHPFYCLLDYPVDLFDVVFPPPRHPEDSYWPYQDRFCPYILGKRGLRPPLSGDCSNQGCLSLFYNGGRGGVRIIKGADVLADDVQ